MTYKANWQAHFRHVALVAGVLAGLVACPATSAPPDGTASRPHDLAKFARPESVPPGPRSTPAEIALGAALFADPRLSRDGSTSCATCHDPARGFTDGASRGKGIAGVMLRRNTPTLWNLAWSTSFFWDGRASTLEQQAQGPIEHPLEMDLKLDEAVRRLGGDPEMVAAFEASYGAQGLTGINLLAALAAFERTLVSPKTRFDRWVEGDASALTSEEIRGFKLFDGRAGCSKCHSGWRFTDDKFHDIGLPETQDKGRGELAGQEAMRNAFKTPTLRELVWTGPYMHDGSMGTIAAANDHYFGGIESTRATLSKDLPIHTPVFASERAALTAFLGTLSREGHAP